MYRLATAAELIELLRQHSGDVRRLLKLPRAQLSIPTDGHGLRVLAEIPNRPKNRHVIIRYNLRGQDIEIPVEVRDTFEKFAVGSGRP